MKYWDCVNDELEEILSKHQGLRRMFRNGGIGYSELLALSDIQIAVQAINNRCLTRHSNAVHRYSEWMECLGALHIPAGPVLDILENGTSFLNIDSQRRKRKGWARGVILRALEHHPLTHPGITHFDRAEVIPLSATMIPAASSLPNQYAMAHL